MPLGERGLRGLDCRSSFGERFLPLSLEHALQDRRKLRVAVEEGVRLLLQLWFMIRCCC